MEVSAGPKLGEAPSKSKCLHKEYLAPTIKGAKNKPSNIVITTIQEEKQE